MKNRCPLNTQAFGGYELSGTPLVKIRFSGEITKDSIRSRWGTFSWNLKCFLNFLFIRNIDAQIWYNIIPKTTKNSIFDHEYFSDENLYQKKHFKPVFGVAVGWEFEKVWFKIKMIQASASYFVLYISYSFGHSLRQLRSSKMSLFGMEKWFWYFSWGHWQTNITQEISQPCDEMAKINLKERIHTNPKDKGDHYTLFL